MTHAIRPAGTSSRTPPAWPPFHPPEAYSANRPAAPQIRPRLMDLEIRCGGWILPEIAATVGTLLTARPGQAAAMTAVAIARITPMISVAQDRLRGMSTGRGYETVALAGMMSPPFDTAEDSALVGEGPGPVAEPEGLQGREAGQVGTAHGGAVELERQRHVLHGGQAGEQVEVLEDVADRLAAHPRLGATRHRVDVLALDEHRACCRFLQGAGDGEQRGLA